MDKKGQGLGIETVVKVVIGIVVLVTVVILLTSVARNYFRVSKDCAARGGKVVSSKVVCMDGEGVPLFTFKDADGKQKVCCVYGEE